MKISDWGQRSNSQRSDSQRASISRRSFLGLAGTALAATALSGCAGTRFSPGGQAHQDDNTITWWSSHPGQSKPAEQELIRRFEKDHPDLTVNLIDAGKNYEECAQKFNAALTGRTVPDIVMLSDVWWFNFALNEQITPIEDVASEVGLDTSTYVTSLYEDYAFNGKHFALPFARSTPLFFYNKDAWKRAGLPDRGPESWDEMDEWGPRLQTDRQKGHGWGNAVDYLSWTFEGPLWTKGGAYSKEWDFTFTSDETIAAVEWLKRTVSSDGYAAISQSLANDFSAGLYASVIASTGDLNGIVSNASFPVGTAALPNPRGTGGCPTGGAGLAIPAIISDKRKKNAATFINYITNTANTCFWSREVGYMPVRKDASADLEMKTFLDEHPNYQTAIDQLPHTRIQDPARVFVPGADQVIGGAFESILTNNADIRSTMKKVDKEISRAYETQIKPKMPS